MTFRESTEVPITRRDVLTASAALLAGGGIGSALTSQAEAAGPAPAAPPLPWPWVEIDPLEAVVAPIASTRRKVAAARLPT